MSEQTGIEWTDHTFNIAWGCEKVSPGCAHCYADGLSRRYGHDVWGAGKARRTFSAKHWAEPLKWNAKAEREGVRRRVFCSSMCDVFEDHPTIDAEREKLWPLIRATPALDWQLLTKRAERIRDHLPSDWGDGYPNVWLGVSVENQRWIARAARLCLIPAAVRFLSCEPLLGPVDLSTLIFAALDRRGVYPFPMLDTEYRTAVAELLHWVIVGGESGPKQRPMAAPWARGIRDQCEHYGVALFLKQLGGFPDKRGGESALLDGRRWTEMPSQVSA